MSGSLPDVPATSVTRRPELQGITELSDDKESRMQNVERTGLLIFSHNVDIAL